MFGLKSRLIARDAVVVVTEVYTLRRISSWDGEDQSHPAVKSSHAASSPFKAKRHSKFIIQAFSGLLTLEMCYRHSQLQGFQRHWTMRPSQRSARVSSNLAVHGQFKSDDR